MAASRAGAKLSAGQEGETGATLSGASISCRVNFNLQLFCDRRFCQHESPKLFLFSPAPFSFLFVFFLGILQRYMYVLRIFLLVLSYFFFGLFGLLVNWYIRLGCRPFGRGAFAISFNDRKKGRTDEWTRANCSCCCPSRTICFISAPSPHPFSLVENSISQMREMRKARKV